MGLGIIDSEYSHIEEDIRDYIEEIPEKKEERIRKILEIVVYLMN